MKILIINPDYGMTQEEMALRCRILEEYTAPDTQLAMVCPQSSGVELNSALDVVLAAPEIVQLAADGQNAGFDAVVLYCFSDPLLSTPAAKHCAFPLSAGRRPPAWQRLTYAAALA